VRVRGEILGWINNQNWVRFPCVSAFLRSHDFSPPPPVEATAGAPWRRASLLVCAVRNQVGKKNDIYVMWMGKSLQVAPEGMTICILSTLLEVRRRSTTHIDHDTNRCGGRDSPTPPPIPSAARPKEGGGGREGS
jgi:hypothetical protein